jgi:hypothetical protein
VAEEYRADEVMLVNILHDHAARRRSYELVATEYGLARAVRGCLDAADASFPLIQRHMS